MMPVYDKPMIYYPLTTLIYSGIKEILIITTPSDIEIFKNLLGDGSKLGCNFHYKIQDEPNGLAQAFVLGEEFIGKDKVCLVLGDNIFYMKRKLLKFCKDVDGAIIFGYHVNDPERYGVVEYDNDYRVLSIEEKPKKPRSNYAVPGLYFYDNNVVEIAKNIKPSKRGEYEITDVNLEYLKREKIKVQLLGRGAAWLDTGTFTSLMQASQFVQVIEDRQGRKIGCIEEAAFKMGLIDDAQLEKLARPLLKSGYGDYLMSLLKK
jgi:glucose-1-phosphate thymidylyltransferase